MKNFGEHFEKQVKSSASFLQAYGMLFVRVIKFKYLWFLNSEAEGDNHREIRQRITTANRYFITLKPVLNSKIFSNKTNYVRLEIVRLIVLYMRVKHVQIQKQTNKKYLHSSGRCF